MGEKEIPSLQYGNSNIMYKKISFNTDFFKKKKKVHIYTFITLCQALSTVDSDFPSSEWFDGKSQDKTLPLLCSRHFISLPPTIAAISLLYSIFKKQYALR